MKWYYWSSLIGIVLFIPVALLAVIIPPNEYVAQGLEAVDCDGPLVVMVLAIPSYIIYGLASIGYIAVYRITRKIFHLLVIIFSVLIIVVITPNVVEAVKEHSKNRVINEDRCGVGW